MPASSEAIRRERIMADDGRTLDFRVSVAPGHAVAISRRQARLPTARAAAGCRSGSTW
jgi:hypothetical protein